MEFDKSRVYTALNADELKVGDLVIVANSIGVLRRDVHDNEEPYPLEKIESEYSSERFVCQRYYFSLAYLVGRKGENKDEIINKLKNEIKELKTHCRAVDDVNAKMKNCANCKYLWSEESAEFCDKCDSEYSKWELKEE